MPKGDARLAQIVGGHLHVDFVADADADEVFPHFAGNMGEDLVAVGQSDTKHRAGQHLADRSLQFNWLFFGHAAAFGFYNGPATATESDDLIIILRAANLHCPRPKIKSNFFAFRFGRGLVKGAWHSGP